MHRQQCAAIRLSALDWCSVAAQCGPGTTCYLQDEFIGSPASAEWQGFTIVCHLGVGGSPVVQSRHGRAAWVMLDCTAACCCLDGREACAPLPAGVEGAALQGRMTLWMPAA